MEIYSDGGARGNPGPAACAFVVFEKNKVFYKEGKYLGRSTNNQAEYNGVLLALKWLDERVRISGPESLIYFYVDSELIAKQINGIYKVKDIALKKLHADVQNILKSIQTKIIFKNIPRAKNKLADFLVNTTLDSHTDEI